MADKTTADAGETVKKYPEATNQVLEYYKTKANDEEKKILLDTIRKAAKSLKQEGRGDKGDKKDKKKGRGFIPPTPEAIAAALYGVLSEGAGGTVDGDPSQGNRTRIDGRFDLNDVARKLMAALA
ncbi:hypothetical protein BH10PSE6_BH10PSE6_58310 [soil metagenome]